ncbi:hypothetical protein D556_2766 [Bordetella holmesii 41130]|nr:hypothetical protein D560_2789 [Bordetella holmesii ATCC 51541]EWM41696.1 hypothetical protein D556_2766 [Bordetella holmesii 41130]
MGSGGGLILDMLASHVPDASGILRIDANSGAGTSPWAISTDIFRG